MPALLLTGLVMAAIGYGASYWYPLRPSADSDSHTSPPVASDTNPTTVKAQGRLEPVTGTLTVSAIPGEEIVKLSAYVGKEVMKDDVLAEVGSQEVRQAERDLAVKQVTRTKNQLAAERVVADLHSKAALLKKQQAMARKQEIPPSTSIQVLSDRIGLAKKRLTQLEELRRDPRTREAIAEAEIRQQELLIQQLEAELQQSTALRDSATETQSLSVTAADLDIEMAQANERGLMDDSGVAVLEQSVTLAGLALQATKVCAPCNGTILEVYARVGERIANAPILQMGDLSQMVCICEVNEANLKDLEVREVREGDEKGKLEPARPYRVTMSSAALEKDLVGHVVEVGRLIGAPALRDPNPLAQTDLRTAKVRIELDGPSTEIAQRFVHMQVNVTIYLKETEDDS